MFSDNVDDTKIYSLVEGINKIKIEKINEHINKFLHYYGTVQYLLPRWVKRCLWHTHRIALKSHFPVCEFIFKKTKLPYAIPKAN